MNILIIQGYSPFIVGNMKELREDTGINYFSFGLNDAELISEFAKSVMRSLRT